MKFNWKHILIAAIFCMGCATSATVNSKPSAEQDWQSARKSNNIPSYQKFIQQHGDSPYVANAQKEIEKLQWDSALRTNNVQAYEKFMREYPNSEFIHAARAKILQLDPDYEFRKSVEAYKNPAALEKLLKEKPEKAGVIIPKIEQMILADITGNGVRERFVIKDIPPKLSSPGTPAQPKAILGGKGTQELLSFDLFKIKEPPSNLPNDPSRFTIKKKHDGGVLIASEFSDDNFFLFSIDIQKNVLADNLYYLYGPRSVHRYSGTVENSGYIFQGSEDILYRLTFGVIKDQGYVYLRGNGSVRKKGGRATRFNMN